MFKLDDEKNNYKNVAHAFFLALAITIAEPSTILPLLVHYFSQNPLIVGLFSSLLRGGAIVVQMYAAFYAQEFRVVLPYLRRVFFFRFLSWFLIGLSIYFFGEKNKTLTLVLIGIGLFFFSFLAGFGAIYFKELQAKLFSKKYRGITMANRQIASSVASILSGVVSGYVLARFEAPLNFAYLFMISSFLMAIGFLIFATIKEPSKENIKKKEKKFKEFLKNSFMILKKDKKLKDLIIIILLLYSYLIAMPFVILKANSSFTLNGWMLGGFISIQMIGSIIGSSFLWKRIHNYEKMLIFSYLFMIAAFFIAIFANNLVSYMVIFLLFGIGLDANKISTMNLIIEIAPEDKRPIYTALVSNITSLGLFFPILGGAILKYFDSYLVLYLVSLFLLCFGMIFSIKVFYGKKVGSG